MKMGLLDSMFGTKHEPLATDNPAARAIEQHGGFEEFVKVANDRIEVVPSNGILYAFVGKPPKAFGLVWFDDDGRHDVQSMVKRGAMTRESATQLAEKLGGIYTANSDATRYEHKVAGHKVIVTPSDALASAIRDAIEGSTA